MKLPDLILRDLKVDKQTKKWRSYNMKKIGQMTGAMRTQTHESGLLNLEQYLSKKLCWNKLSVKEQYFM